MDLGSMGAGSGVAGFSKEPRATGLGLLASFVVELGMAGELGDLSGVRERDLRAARLLERGLGAAPAAGAAVGGMAPVLPADRRVFTAGEAARPPAVRVLAGEVAQPWHSHFPFGFVAIGGVRQ